MAKKKSQSAIYLITAVHPFGYRTKGGARRALGNRKGFAIWFSHDMGWYLKRGRFAFGRRHMVMEMV